MLRRWLLHSALALSSVAFTLALAEGSSYLFHFPVPHLDDTNIPLKALAFYLPPPELASTEADLAKARRYTKEQRKELNEKAARFGLDYSGKLIAKGHSRSVLRIQGEGSIVYDVAVHIDERGRRNPSGLGPKKGPALVLLGDSYVFGEGLSEEENISQRLRDLQPNRAIYNMGISGLGPNDLLRSLETDSKEFFAGIPIQGSTAIFLYNTAQSGRANCSLSNYANKHLSYRLPKPLYSLKADGSLKYQGPCNGNTFRDRLFRALSHSNFLKINNIDWPPERSGYAKQLVAKLLLESRRIMMEQLGVERFVVVAYPDATGSIQEDLPFFREVGLEVLDFVSLDIESATNGDRVIPADFHPSPSAAVVLAHLLNYSFPSGQPGR